MINDILQDSLSISQTEDYYLTHIGWEDIEKFLLETKNDRSLKKIKIIALDNLNFLTYYKNFSKETKAIVKSKLLRVKGYFWSDLCNSKRLSEDFIREFQDKLHWYYICCQQKLSENFIHEFQHKVSWDQISCYQNLSEEFIRRFQHKVDWHIISRHQRLSEEFIREFQDKVDWVDIYRRQNISEEFEKEFAPKAISSLRGQFYLSVGKVDKPIIGVKVDCCLNTVRGDYV